MLFRSVSQSRYDDQGKFSQVAHELNQLGYRPHVLKKNQDSHGLKMIEERHFLLRMGVAAAGASNIMLYAVSLYAGAQDTYAKVFNFLTVVFAFPVLTYSAYPFYRNAWHSIKNKNLSIDVPISMSLILGGVMGVYNLLQGIHENYFDSLTTLVFLLLISRYFLKKIQEKALSNTDLHFFYQSESVQRLIKEDTSFKQTEEVHPQYIRTGDLLKVSVGQFIPADGKIIKGRSYLNMSLLTGESQPVVTKKGDKVFAGTQNISEDLIIEVEKHHGETRLGEILLRVESGWSQRPPIVDVTDRIAKYFILSVFMLSVILFAYVYQNQSFKFALEHALTLLIVTCPCALALSVPLTFTRAMNKASDNGIIIKNEAVIEKLSEIQNIFIDKTGTLTYGKYQIQNLQQIKKLQKDHTLYDVLYSLEKFSHHPMAKALIQYISRHNPVEMKVGVS